MGDNELIDENDDDRLDFFEFIRLIENDGRQENHKERPLIEELLNFIESKADAAMEGGRKRHEWAYLKRRCGATRRFYLTVSDGHVPCDEVFEYGCNEFFELGRIVGALERMSDEDGLVLIDEIRSLCNSNIASLTENGRELIRKETHKKKRSIVRHAGNRALRGEAERLFQEREWSSVRQASKKIALALHAFAENEGVTPLSETNRDNTVYRWLLDFNKINNV
jgi:hypothetical protein